MDRRISQCDISQLTSGVVVCPKTPATDHIFKICCVSEDFLLRYTSAPDPSSRFSSSYQSHFPTNNSFWKEEEYSIKSIWLQ